MALTKSLRILVATHNPHVLGVLEAQFKPYELVEALSTDGVRASLLKVDLGIIDVGDLAPVTVRREDIVAMLQAHPIPTVSSQDFLTAPAAYRQRALASAGAFAGLEKKIVLVTAYSGGVGKTSVSLDLALYFAAETHLPTALMELGYGPSALRTLTGAGDGVDFQRAATQNRALPNYHGVALVPYDHESCGGTDDAHAQAFIEKLYTEHTLLIVDAEFPHPWLRLFQARPKTVLILASPKPDAWANASYLHQYIPEALLIFNMVRGRLDKFVQTGLKRDLDVPYLNDFAGDGHLDGRLAKATLPLVYPGWRPK